MNKDKNIKSKIKKTDKKYLKSYGYKIFFSLLIIMFIAIITMTAFGVIFIFDLSFSTKLMTTVIYLMLLSNLVVKTILLWLKH